MKHAFFVTSSIEIDPNKPLKGVPKRTSFTTEQRLEQTIQTLKNLKEKDPTASIYFVDSSVTYFKELDDLGLSNFNYINLEKINPTVAETVRTYSSKSYGECLMILEFFKHFKKELAKFDFITKICGRYTLGNDYNVSDFKPWLKNKFFMKKELAWAGEHINHLSETTMPRDILVDNTLYGFYTVVHAFGTNRLDHYEAIMSASAQMQMEHGKYYLLDVEYTVHLYIRLFDLMKDVETVNWTVDGQCGVTGRIVRY